MGQPFDRLKTALADRYTLERELGRGGMATVYLAEDLKHKRKVAIKVLHPELAAALGPDRFLREIEIAARLQHPHILPLFDSGHAGGFLYYVMPYVEGESLRGRLVRVGALPIPEAARILRDVADALGHAHARGVVHRDIKPENVMLSGRHALVTDFGVAKAVSEASGRQQLTTAGVALGTPAYMAPEQAAADPNMDHRVDVYALGVVAYELLTGRPPFEGGSPQETLAAHVTKAPQPVSTHRSTVPPMLAQLVMKCLEKRPADRCQKADELVGQLEGFTTPSGGITPTDTRPISAIRNATRRPGAIVAVIGLLALGLYASGLWRQNAGNGPVNPKAVRVAVLPLENLGRSQDEFLADGITSAIHGEIRRIPGLFVKGLRTSMQYKGSREALQDIGGELQVDYVLAGTIQWDGQERASSKVRVTMDLVRVADETSVWQKSFDRDYADVFALQSDIARLTTESLSGSLGKSVKPPLASNTANRPSNTEATTLYLKGRAELMRFTAAGYDEARKLLERAVLSDSHFAPAWGALAEAALNQRVGDLRLATAAARRGMDLDSNSAEVVTSFAATQWGNWEFEASVETLQRAITLEPNYGHAHGLLSYYLAGLGRSKESEQVGRTAAVLDPLAWADAPIFGLLQQGRFDDVISYARAGLALDSNQTANLWWLTLGRALIEKGQIEDALYAFERQRVIRQEPRFAYGWVYARVGRRAEAESMLREALAVPRLTDIQQIYVILIYSHLGPSDSAFAWLDRLYSRRAAQLTGLKRNPFAWAPISSDPRFKELLRKIGLEK